MQLYKAIYRSLVLALAKTNPSAFGTMQTSLFTSVG